jgi:ADP-ribosyl-[dinitrogen reductase] hydrolase
VYIAFFIFVDFDIPNGIIDDTQLTIATCESIIETKRASPEGISKHFLKWFNSRMLTGLGSNTLKALRDLQAGAHWGLSGQSGEYAAGNGAAMRIAQLAFLLNISEERMLIRDICNITHKNDEAYVGCLSILHSLDSIITGQWKYGQDLIDLVAPFLPDTSVKDNLLTLGKNPSISILDAARLIHGRANDGHFYRLFPSFSRRRGYLW